MSARLRAAGALLCALTLAGCSSSAPGEGGGSPAPATVRPSGTTTPEQSLGLSYVALGDSFTAAPGVGQPTGPGACFRTDANYPHLLAERLGLDLADVSCAGATSRDLHAPQPLVGVPAQLAAVTSRTELVTLSIGANDGGLFAALASQCVGLGQLGQERRARSCVGDERFAEDRLRAELAELSRETVRSVRAIRKRAPRAELVVVGYPQLVPARGTCEALPLDPDEVPFVHEVNSRVAAAVKDGARTARVAYVDMWSASEGHDACAPQPWVAGLRPVGPGAPLHPYAAHQAAVADALAALVS